MASNVKFSRRRLIAGAASASALSIASPFIRTAHAAGSLSIGFWDHWVPGANDSLTKLCKEWGEKEKVDVKIDYITSQGSKLQLTAVAEAQAKSGHDILQLTSWDAPNQAKNLVPVDDIVNAAIKRTAKRLTSLSILERSMALGSAYQPPMAVKSRGLVAAWIC